MANNRMYLKCKEDGERVAISKYYPGSEVGGWYTTEVHFNQTNEFFIKHAHDFDNSNFGGEQYLLEYETPITLE